MTGCPSAGSWRRALAAWTDPTTPPLPIWMRRPDQTKPDQQAVGGLLHQASFSWLDHSINHVREIRDWFPRAKVILLGYFVFPNRGASCLDQQTLAAGTVPHKFIL